VYDLMNQLPAVPGHRWELCSGGPSIGWSARLVSAASGAVAATWDEGPEGWSERYEVRGPLYDVSAIDMARVFATTTFGGASLSG
jgi:hypothetical protein